MVKFTSSVVLLGALLAAAAVSVVVAEGPPPLKVDKSKPLLLLDEPQAKPAESKSGKPAADNSACYVCHTNYQEEEMVTQHAKENVGCVKCHGESLPHRNDENNTTPPEKMYPTESIDRACMECHETHDAPAKKVLTRWQQRCPAKTDPTLLVCTDCHGEHRLKHRTVRWDKKSGKLLMEPQSPTKPIGKKTESKQTPPVKG